MSTDLIDQFIAHYMRELDFFEQAGRLVSQQLDSRLQASGIRAMVTSRAKNPRRLESKIRHRAGTAQYATFDDIYSDIVDLAGVRVALYFPGELKEVDKIIRDQFDLTSAPREYTGTLNPSHAKRFSGYWATHYRLRLRDSSLPAASQRYSYARVEVQVASVLMHAWAEVEHDLVYKPLQGKLSEDELAILDELNGMVLAGEIALGRLQRAAELRVKGEGARFENHYDLASFLLEAAKRLLQDGNSEPRLGDVELLFQLLGKLDLLRPEALRPYVESLSPDTELRPMAQQITDQVLAADPERYHTYGLLRADSAAPEAGITAAYAAQAAPPERVHAALGFFIARWIALERFLREFAPRRPQESRGPAIPSPGVLRRLAVFNQEELAEIERIRRTRNQLVHGVEVPDVEYIDQMARFLEALLARLAQDERRDVRRAAQSALGLELD